MIDKAKGWSDEGTPAVARLHFSEPILASVELKIGGLSIHVFNLRAYGGIESPSIFVFLHVESFYLLLRL